MTVTLAQLLTVVIHLRDIGTNNSYALIDRYSTHSDDSFGTRQHKSRGLLLYLLILLIAAVVKQLT